jgi:hypothetical protein
MILLIPVPTWTSKLISAVQRKKMAAVRVPFRVSNAAPSRRMVDGRTREESEGNSRRIAHGEAVRVGDTRERAARRGARGGTQMDFPPEAP